LRELRIEKNESQQRLDRFLKKYLADATQGFIYKMIRKKNIKVNDERAKPDMMLNEGDLVQLYLAEETIEKFKGERQHKRSRIDLQDCLPMEPERTSRTMWLMHWWVISLTGETMSQDWRRPLPHLSATGLTGTHQE
jgi:23S rRNA-/tRNA-specific pseudouridylate synthase